MVETAEEPELFRQILNRSLLASRAGVSHQCLRPDPSLVQIRVLESLASLHKTPRPRRQPVSPRGKKRVKQKAEASLDTVPVSILQAPQSEVGAELGKKKQEIGKTPSAALSIALAPPAAESMPRGKKRKELASETDGESEEEQGNVKFWLLF